MLKIFNFFYAFLLALLAVGVTLMAEEVTLTTYYPAPFGNYEELQARKLAVGSAATMPSNDGEAACGKIAVGSSASMPSNDGDLTATGTVRSNTGFNVDGTDGFSGTYTVVTDVQLAGLNVQKRTRTITVAGGIITGVSDESGWQ